MDGRGNKLSSSVGRCALKRGREEIGKKDGPGEFNMGIGRRKRLAAKKDIKYGQIPSNGLRGFSARVRVKRKKVCGMMVGLPLCCLDFHSGKYCSRFSNRKTREREREREKERETTMHILRLDVRPAEESVEEEEEEEEERRDNKLDAHANA